MEIHKGIYGNHISARTLAHKALGYGYYWLKMKLDAINYVQHYDKCQRFSKVTQQSPKDLTTIVSL